MKNININKFLFAFGLSLISFCNASCNNASNGVLTGMVNLDPQKPEANLITKTGFSNAATPKSVTANGYIVKTSMGNDIPTLTTTTQNSYKIYFGLQGLISNE